MKWIALFSQTGSEISTLSNKIGRVPDTILTNNKKYKGDLDPLISEHSTIMLYLVNNHKHDLITLHGYLRIIPENICKQFKHIYNGHPGLINMYPELKGKDPQERIKPYMSLIGSVVHKVTPEVDAGEIVNNVAVKYNRYDYYNILRETSLEAWEQFFEKY